MGIGIIRHEDIPVALRIINEEGWGYSEGEIQRLVDLEPEGSFFFLDRAPVAAVTTVVHDGVGVIGHLVVSRKARGKGVGRTLLGHALRYLDSKGVDSTIVYATEEGAPLYSRFSFVHARAVLCRHAMIGHEHTRRQYSGVRPIERRDLAEVIGIDADLFGADRTRMINTLYDELPQACFKLMRRDKIAGFSMGRRTPEGHDFGPWACMTGMAADAEELLKATYSAFSPGRVFMGVFHENKPALAIVNRLPEYGSWNTKLMVRGRQRCYPSVEGVYGIAAFELG